MEIERKFLVSGLPDGMEQFPHCEMEQAYLCTQPTVRVRRAGEVCWLTVKERRQPEGSTAIVNREEEFRLAPAKYQALLAKCEGQVVRKTRYRIDLRRSEADGLYTNYMAELDIFHGPHEGLRLVEVEFPSVAEADAFVPPAWFGTDVSADPRYRNSYLAFNNNIMEDSRDRR